MPAVHSAGIVVSRSDGQRNPGGLREHIDIGLPTELFDDSRYQARNWLGVVALVGIAGLGSTKRTRRDGAIRSAGPGLAAALAGGADIEEALGRLVVSSLGLVCGADFAKISVIDHGRLRTIAASSQLAASLDSVQHVAGHGPCLDAISGGSAVPAMIWSPMRVGRDSHRLLRPPACAASCARPSTHRVIPAEQ